MIKKIFKGFAFFFLLLISCIGFVKTAFQANNTDAATLSSINHYCNCHPWFQVTLKFTGISGYPNKYTIWMFDSTFSTTYSGGALPDNDEVNSHLIGVATEENCEFVETFERNKQVTLRVQSAKYKDGITYDINDPVFANTYYLIVTYGTESNCRTNARSLGKLYGKAIQYPGSVVETRYLTDMIIDNASSIDFGFFAPLESVNSTVDGTVIVNANGVIQDKDKFKAEITFTTAFKHYKINFKEDQHISNTLATLDDINYTVPAVPDNLKTIYTSDLSKTFDGLYTYSINSGEVVYVSQVYDKNFNYCYTGNVPSYFAVYPKYIDGNYTLEYNGNNATSGIMDRLTNLKIHDNTLITLDYNNYYKIGYDFAGWSTTLNGEVVYENQGTFNPSDYDKVIGTVITLYAVWTPKSHTVTIDLNNGSNQKYTYQLNYNSPFTYNIPEELLVHAGYEYDGFTEQLPDTMPNNDVTIKVKWKPLEYKIEFYLDEACTLLYKRIKYPYGNVIDTSSIVEPGKDGCQFVDWSSSMPETMPAEDIRVYAVWEVGTFELTYYPGHDLPDEKYYIRYGNSLPLPPDYNIITGYQFKGWDQVIPETMPSKNLFISGVWEELYFNVHFVLENGLEDIVYKVRHGASLEGISPNPVRTNYNFTGWNEEIPSVMPANDLYFYANWELKHYTVLFVDAQDGKDIYYTVEAGQDIVIPQAYKDYHQFVGWDKEILAIAPEYDLEYTALWEIDYYKIYFDTDGGSTIAPLSYAYGDAINLNVSPKKDGNDFVSWDKQLPLTMPGYDITLKAIWAKRPYTITYYCDDDVFFTDSYSFGEKVNTMPYIPEKEGYRFVEWVGTIPNVMDSHDYEVFASFKIIQYKIIFESNSLNQYEDQIIDYAGKVQKVENPSKTDYIFKGWFTDCALSNEYNFDDPVYSNLTLYAKFKEIEKKEEFVQDADSFKISIDLSKSIDATTTLESTCVTNENLENYKVEEIFDIDYSRYLSEDIAIGALYKLNLKYNDKVVNYDNMTISLETPDIIRGKQIYVYHVYGDTVEELTEYEIYDGKISITCNQLDEFAIFYEIIHEQVTPDTTKNVLLYVSIAVGVLGLAGFGILTYVNIMKAQRRKRNSWIDDL